MTKENRPHDNRETPDRGARRDVAAGRGPHPSTLRAATFPSGGRLLENRLFLLPIPYSLFPIAYSLIPNP